MKPFNSPKKFLGEIDTETAAELVAAVADIALILDRDGIVRDIATQTAELSAEIGARWLGRTWASTVTADGRDTIQSLLQDAAGGASARWRRVTHIATDGGDLPFDYCAIEVGTKGRFVAVGRDLRAVATLQQRLADARQSIDREYSRLRSAETRNRMLFHLASEAMLVLDAMTLRIVEVNPAATQMFGLGARRVAGRAFPEFFDADGGAALASMLASVRGGSRSPGVVARLADGSHEVLMTASVFREERSTLLMLRATELGPDRSPKPTHDAGSRFLGLAEASLDGVVVTDAEGRVMAANPAFLDLVQVANEEQAIGESIGIWLGRCGIDLYALLAQLRQHGMARSFVTTLTAANGALTDIEICAVAIAGRDPSCYGYIVRDIGPRAIATRRSVQPLSRSVEQLTELVGRVPLRDIVRETSETIERLCIEAALKLTDDNRASAAEMLGLSRQSLYVKLRLYGLGDLVDPSSER